MYQAVASVSTLSDSLELRTNRMRLALRRVVACTAAVDCCQRSPKDRSRVSWNWVERKGRVLTTGGTLTDIAALVNRQQHDSTVCPRI